MHKVFRFLMVLFVAYATQASAGPFKKGKVRGVHPNLIEAWNVRPHGIKLSAFMEACEDGDKTGCNEAAWLMETSLEVTDRNGAEALLKTNGTCVYERRAFSSCIQEGRVVPTELGCKSGLAPMCRLLGDTLTRLKRVYLEPLKAFKAACMLNDGVSCRKAAAIVAHQTELPKADERLLRERGCDLGESTECWKLAQWHARGSHGYARDHEQYKVLMAETERLDKVAEQRWTEVRRAIQQDALNRLGQARQTWIATRDAKGRTYCMHHSTGRNQWVEGTIDGDKVVSWKGCQRVDNDNSCETRRGAPPSSMEALFDRCERILNASPATYEFGFRARPDGSLGHCYTHAEGSEIRGESVSTSRIGWGACE